MPGLSVVDSSTASPLASVCADDLEPAICHELAVLADIEAGYRSSCEWLQRWQGPEAIKNRLATQLEARHRVVREAHVLHLASLHQRTVSGAIFGDLDSAR